MNILFLRDILFRGGIEILLLDICKNAKRSGLNITLITFHEGELDEEFKNLDINFKIICRKYAIDFSLINSIRKIVLDNNISVIHSNQAIEGLYAYLATKGLKVKNIISHHGSIYPFKDKLVMKFLINRVFANIAVSESYLTILKEKERFKIRDNFFVIYNGIDFNKINASYQGLKEELKISVSSKLLGMIGNFNGIRNQMLICKALPEIFNKFPNTYFIFVGRKDQNPNGNYGKCYEFCKKNKILDRTFFLGLRNDIGNILSSLDIFVYSSIRDTFGIAVVEAMHSALPVIINDIPPMLEISDNGKYAKVYKTDDVFSLIDAMSEILENESLRENITINTKQWVVDNFSIETHINSLKKLYSSDEIR